jgi:hypothetical protein
MSETKVIEENGLRITLNYEIVDEDAFNALVDEKDDEDNPNAHPFDGGPTSMLDAQVCWDDWKDRIEDPDAYYSLTEVHAIKKACLRRLEEYKSGVRKPDPVYMLYEELLPFFKDCYGDNDERIENLSGYFIYDAISENKDGFSKVIEFCKRGEKMEAFKLTEEIIENSLSEWRERKLKS